MIIQNTESDINVAFSYLNNYPDPFVPEKEKLGKDSYIKNTMDYFSNMAFSQYWENKQYIEPNYKLLNGIIDESHFYDSNSYDQPVVKDFLQTIKDASPLPPHVKHYSAINPVINALQGELQKRPDIHRVRAYDDASKSEELEYKTDIMQQLILQHAKQIILNKMAIQGQDASQIDDEQLQSMTFDSAKDMLTDFTSVAEQWGNKVLTLLKTQFNLKDKSEDAFYDLTACAREFYEVYEDNSSLGFNVRNVNPKNVWWKGTPDTKYVSGVSGDANVPYCIGTIHVKEISEILMEFPEITKEEIDHLKLAMQNALLLRGKESNLFNGTDGGINSIHYQTYNPLIYQQRMVEQSLIGNEFKDNLTHFLGGSNAFSFGYKYVVVKAYWHSKKKIGRLTYMDEDGSTQTTLVDETYKKSPNEISIEWDWVNQWYQGAKIGPDIYYIKPLEFLDYAPIIGMIYRGKNTVPMSLVDQMKPIQAMINLGMNQLWELWEKEIGVVAVINKRRIPKDKDMDAQDALEIMVDEARELGILEDDDSPENTKGSMQNQTVARGLDLSRTNEIRSRLETVIQLQEMLWQLVGMNRQRLGSPLATETATANQNALVQSFAQTEPWFTAHTNVLTQLYQAILDAAQYVESKKPQSTLSLLNSAGYADFLQVLGSDINLRALGVFITSKAEDQQLFNEFRQLAQPMLQNGATLYEVSQLYVTNSIREMQRMFKQASDKREYQFQQQQQLEQQRLEQEQQQFQAEQEKEERFHDDEIQIRKYEAELRANTDLAKAEIMTFVKVPETDSNQNNVPDIIDIANHQLKIQEQLRARDLDNKKLTLEQNKFMSEQKQKVIDNKMSQQKLKLEAENVKIKRKVANKKPATPKTK